MTRKVTAAIRRTSTAIGSGRFFTRTAAFAFLLVSAIVLADAIRVAECRTLQNNDNHSQRYNREAMDDTRDYLSDGAATGDDDEETDTSADETAGTNDEVTPIIITTGLVVDSAEGTTVNLPCKVVKSSLEDVALIWVNDTKTIMTDTFPSTTDIRVKQADPPQTPTPGYEDHTLVIEQVTRYDSGTYTCRVTSTPPVEITHTLRVTHPAKILSVQPVGAVRSSNSGDGKKYSLKQGEPVQLLCTVAGYPNPTVQWTRRAKYQNLLATTQSPNQTLASSAPLPSMTAVVSNTNELRIESVAAYRDAGYYECTAQNSGTASGPSVTRSGFELEIEYQPDVVVPQRVVNTGESYTAQLACSVHANPKPKVSWEKKQIAADESESWQTLQATNDVRDSRYEMTRPLPNAATVNTGNNSMTPPGPKFLLKVKQVQGQDFGQYRCRAENTLGVSYSEPITLSGTPGRPQLKSVENKPQGGSELEWDLDSLSPVMDYQLQYRRQQDSLSSWTDVRPQPVVIDTTTTGGNPGDERRYVMSYIFGGAHQSQNADVLPQTLQHGTTYVARLRARNFHGWSDWSADVVFSGGLDDGQWDNEITHQLGNDHDKILKASAAGGASSQQRLSSIAAATIALAVAVTTAVYC